MTTISNSMLLAKIEGTIEAEAAIFGDTFFDDLDQLEQHYDLALAAEVCAEELYSFIAYTVPQERTALQKELIQSIHRKALKNGFFHSKFRELQHICKMH